MTSPRSHRRDARTASRDDDLAVPRRAGRGVRGRRQRGHAAVLARGRVRRLREPGRQREGLPSPLEAGPDDRHLPLGGSPRHRPGPRACSARRSTRRTPACTRRPEPGRATTRSVPTSSCGSPPACSSGPTTTTAGCTASRTRGLAERFYRHGSRLATTLQVPADRWPATLEDFWAYWEQGQARIRIDEPVRALPARRPRGEVPAVPAVGGAARSRCAGSTPASCPRRSAKRCTWSGPTPTRPGSTACSRVTCVVNRWTPGPLRRLPDPPEPLGPAAPAPARQASGLKSTGRAGPNRGAAGPFSPVRARGTRLGA